MDTFIQFVFLGLSSAAVYALLAQGIVVIYRGSGVVNFAHGALAMFGAYVFAGCASAGDGAVVGLVAAVGSGAVVGALIQNVIMRPLRTAASITRTIATLAVFIGLVAAAAIKYADSVVVVSPYLSPGVWHLGAVFIEQSQIELFAIAIAATVALSLLQRRTTIGLAMAATAENEVGASVLGWSPNALATVSWAAGGALAGLAGALFASGQALIGENLALLIVPALAAALLGRFVSFYGALLGATGIGIAESLSYRYVTQPGFNESVPFLAIVAVLVISGRALPLRSQIAERLQSLGSGRIRPLPVAATTALFVCLMLWVFNTMWIDALTDSLTVAIMLLSIVVVTGYAGQISLGQYALGGLGAYVAGRLVATQGWPFEAAALAGIVLAVPLGLIFAVPALRTRGVNLAVVTLGLGIGIYYLLFNNASYTGGLGGTTVASPRLFGLNISDIAHPDRYGVVVVVAFALVALAVAALRRSAAGRRLIAIRMNERAAASLGISVVGAKLYAFGAGSAIAAVAGILIAFTSTSIVYTSSFDPLLSIYAAGFAIIGGAGYILGPLLGSTLSAGGIATLLNPLFSGIATYLTLIGAIVMAATLILNPDGLVPGITRALGPVRRLEPFGRLRRRLPSPRIWGERAELLPDETAPIEHPAPQRLEIRGLTIRYGSVVAVDNVSLQVHPGEIVGLIGPNGAGKTSLIDGITGFARLAAGEVSLGAHELTGKTATRCARAGLVRSWQSLELFEDITAHENLLIASDRCRTAQGIHSRAWPRRAKLSPSAAAAVREFGLADVLEQLPSDLPYGQRRLLGIARAIALGPSVLLLDEPAAGLHGAESEELATLVRSQADQRGIGILLVEHDMAFVMSVCDRIVVLDFGHLIAEGTPAEIRANPIVRTAYLGTDDESDVGPTVPVAP